MTVTFFRNAMASQSISTYILITVISDHVMREGKNGAFSNSNLFLFVASKALCILIHRDGHINFLLVKNSIFCASIGNFHISLFIVVWKIQICFSYNNVKIRDDNGPGRPRAGPENPGPRALWAETGLKLFI